MIEVKVVTVAAFTENNEHVFTLAEASLVEDFVDECTVILTGTVSIENMCQSYYLVMKHACEDLLESYERKIILHSDQVFASKGFRRRINR